MNLDWLQTGAWLFGIFGVGGLIALAIFAPAAVTMILLAIKSFLAKLLQSRPGVAVLFGTVSLILGLLAGDYYGRTTAEAACEAAKQAAIAAAAARDKSIADAESEFAQQQAAEAAALNAGLKEKVTAYEEQIKSLGDKAVCRAATDDDERRLLDLTPATAGR